MTHITNEQYQKQFGRFDLNDYKHIVLHFDGNVQDIDDVSAMPVAAMLAKAGGIESRTTILYGNNLGQINGKEQLAALDVAGGYARSLGIKTLSYQDNATKATNQLVRLINSGEKVVIFEGGPLEATYRALSQANPAYVKNVVMVSHSGWNNVWDRTDIDVDLHRIKHIKQDFPEVTIIQIEDQNGRDPSATDRERTHNEEGFYNVNWDWMDSSNDPYVREAREIMHSAGENKQRFLFEDGSTRDFIERFKYDDASDAGMLFWGLTGNEYGTPLDAKTFIEKGFPLGGDTTGDGVSEGQNGLVVIEAESTTPVGDWKIRDINLDVGKSLYWTSDTNSYRQPVDTLSYNFTVDKAGDYYMSIRSFRPDNGKAGDLNNDYFVCLKDPEGNILLDATKMFFSGTRGEWKWAKTLEVGNHKFEDSIFRDLEAGEIYTLEISGRSMDVAIDRIHINQDGFDRNINNKASPIVFEGDDLNDVPVPLPSQPKEPEEPVVKPEPSSLTHYVESGEIVFGSDKKAEIFILDPQALEGKNAKIENFDPENDFLDLSSIFGVEFTKPQFVIDNHLRLDYRSYSKDMLIYIKSDDDANFKYSLVLEDVYDPDAITAENLLLKPSVVSSGDILYGTDDVDTFMVDTSVLDGRNGKIENFNPDQDFLDLSDVLEIETSDTQHIIDNYLKLNYREFSKDMLISIKADDGMDFKYSLVLEDVNDPNAITSDNVIV